MTVARISRVHAPVTVLGPGRRLGIWFQGCSIGCRGCVSRDTWDAGAGRELPVAELAAHCRDRIEALGLEGITLSGGEPFEQPEALAELLTELAPWCEARGIDRLCYSGLPMKRLTAEYSHILALLDAVMPEPFAMSQPNGEVWRGSANQPLVLLSALARQRYREVPKVHPGLQVSVDSNRVWFIGIPREGDMDRITRGSAERGLALEDVSWLP
jgi:anaerobic ribonucleoside-triphosphate reductase activating protein